jgi:hypothetical protein
LGCCDHTSLFHCAPADGTGGKHVESALAAATNLFNGTRKRLWRASVVERAVDGVAVGTSKCTVSISAA